MFSNTEGYEYSRAHTCKECGVNYIEWVASEDIYSENYFLTINNKDYNVHCTSYKKFLIYKYNMQNNNYNLYPCSVIPWFSAKGLTKEQFANKIKTYLIFE